MIDKQGIIMGGQYFSASMSSKKPYYDYQGAYNYDSSRYFADYPYDANCINGAVYLNVDGTASWRNAGSQSANAQIVFPCVPCGDYSPDFGKNGIASFFWTKAPNAYNSMAAMCPIYIFVKRSDGNYSLLGWAEGVRFLNCTNYSVAEEITYGDETWMIFHANSVEDTPANMYTGFAFCSNPDVTVLAPHPYDAIGITESAIAAVV